MFVKIRKARAVLNSAFVVKDEVRIVCAGTMSAHKNQEGEEASEVVHNLSPLYANSNEWIGA